MLVVDHLPFSARIYHRFKAAEPALVLAEESSVSMIGQRGYLSKSICAPMPTSVDAHVLADELPMHLLSFSSRPEEPGPQWNWMEHRQVTARLLQPAGGRSSRPPRSFEFTPHVTLLKSRGPKERRLMKAHFNESLYEALQNSHGTSTLESIDLLEMKGSGDGFYEKYASARFAAEEDSEFVRVYAEMCPRLQGFIHPKAHRSFETKHQPRKQRTHEPALVQEFAGAD